MIRLSDNYTDLNDIKAVGRVVKSGWFTQGPRVEEFEKKFAEYIGVKYAIAVNSCTAALHLAIKSIGIKNGDEVIVPSLSFVATANCVLFEGGRPVFAEVNPDTLNIDPEDIEKKISIKTKAIIPVHFAGMPAEMDSINKIANENNLFVIEDDAHAIGAKYKDKMTGNLGDIGCFSFYSNKNITTGEGGMLTTNDKKFAEIVKMARTHGMSKSLWERIDKKASWNYDIVELGYNYRMNEMGAALGIEQLKKLEIMNKKRIRNAKMLTNLLKGINEIVIPKVEKHVKHVFYIFPIRMTNTKISRDDFIEKLRINGIETGVHYPPIHLFTLYRKLFGYKPGDLPITETVSQQLVTLPMHQKLNKKEIKYVANTVKAILED
jgi:dTDP-4-amino-4,6-dideoxygalactose transaminase